VETLGIYGTDEHMTENLRCILDFSSVRAFKLTAIPFITHQEWYHLYGSLGDPLAACSRLESAILSMADLFELVYHIPREYKMLKPPSINSIYPRFWHLLKSLRSIFVGQ
jgi:hypothetical protein